MNSPRYSADSVVSVDSFRGWQAQVYNIIQTNSWCLRAPRVNMICDTRGKTGKHLFAISLVHSDPSRFLVIYCDRGGISTQGLANEANNARKKGWNGESCIIIAVLERLDSASCNALEMAAEGHILVRCEPHFAEYWQPANIWLFTREVPDLMRSVASVWKVYKMDDSSIATVPDLREVSFLDSLDLFCGSN